MYVLYVYIPIYAQVCAYVCVREEFSSIIVTFNFLRQGLLLNLELTDPARLAGQKPYEMACLCLWNGVLGLVCGVYSMLEIQTQVLCLYSKHFTRWDISPDTAETFEPSQPWISHLELH